MPSHRLLATFVLLLISLPVAGQDLALIGGRVMDPETGLDAVRNVVIDDGRIVAITTELPSADEVIDVADLVVAPGFIDLHAHGQDMISNRFQVADGVTTAMDLEIGKYPVAKWYESRQGNALLHYGATVAHVVTRYAAVEGGVSTDIEQFSTEAFAAESARQPVTEQQTERILALHIVHINSSTGEDAKPAIALIRAARDHGVDVTTESYPYTAGSTLIESALFDDWAGDYADLQWAATGERLNEESYGRYRKEGGWVIIHGRREETSEWIVAQPDVIVASDGITFEEGPAHPRGAGCYARILGHYVRDRGALDLMTALSKMSLQPARRLEEIAPQMKKKGRVQVGADADLTIFDPATVRSRATYGDSMQMSEGIQYVLVGGTPVVRNGEIVEGLAPGQPIYGRHRN
jgi:dihydroorotase